MRFPLRFSNPARFPGADPSADAPTDDDDPTGSRRRGPKWLQTALSIGALLVSVLVLAGGVAIATGVLHLQVVTSGSMQPTISPGDVAITMSTPMNRIVVGDAIAFYPPTSTQPVLHRITSIDTSGGTTVTTRGDANRVDDSWHATLVGPTAYRLVAVIPFVGWLTQFRGAILLLGGLLVALVVIREIATKWKEAHLHQDSTAS